MSEVSEEFRNKRLHFVFALGDRAAAPSGRIERNPRVAVGHLGVNLDCLCLCEPVVGVHRRWPQEALQEVRGGNRRRFAERRCREELVLLQVRSWDLMWGLINDVEAQHSTGPFLLSERRDVR